MKVPKSIRAHNEGWPYYPSVRVLRRRIGRWIRRFEKKHGQRSQFRTLENAKRFR